MNWLLAFVQGFGPLAVLLAVTPVGAQGDVNRGRQLVLDHRCYSCHSEGTSEGLPEAPYIQGQKLYYLEKQLTAFQRARRPRPSDPRKPNERSHPAMRAEPSLLNDADIRNVAEYLANLPCIPRQRVSIQFRDPPSKAQRCIYCHGATGVNPYDIIPNLGGQKKAYLREQLTAFRASALDQAPIVDYERFHRMMAPSVFDLTDREIDGLAEYYAGQSCR